MTYDKGNRHIHGWVLSEEQAMNQEGLDQSSWKQILKLKPCSLDLKGERSVCWFLISPCSGAYSDWFHLQIHWFADSQPQARTCLLQAVIIQNHTLSVKKEILGNEPSAVWNCKIKPDFWLINCELKSLNALRDVSLSDHILSQYKELMLGFLSTSWWTQDWWHVPDIDLCTEKTINKHLNWLIQSCPPCLHQAFWLACCEKLKLFFNLIIPCKINYTAFDGFSTLITGLVNTRIRVKVSDGSTYVT